MCETVAVDEAIEKSEHNVIGIPIKGHVTDFPLTNTCRDRKETFIQFDVNEWNSVVFF